MSWVDPRHVVEAPVQDDPRDEIARIIDPQSWMLRERAMMPYRENRGAWDLENWLYAVTWQKGFRTPEQVDEWLRSGEIQFAEHTSTFHSQFQDSLRRADAILEMLKERSLLGGTQEGGGIAPTAS